MAKLITFECDPTEVRMAVGSTGLTGVSVEHVLAAPLALEPGEELLGSAKAIDVIRQLLKKANVKSGEAIVCIGRSSIELRSITLPSVDANELPDMVRFAAQRQFASVGDSWPIDFVTIPSATDANTECMAAAMNPALIDRIQKMAEAVGLSARQLVLRPMASATMAIVKHSDWSNASVLLVDTLQEEADLVVVERNHVVFMRTFRFTGAADSAQKQQMLISEIKRTLMAAVSQRPTLSVDRICIWGSSSNDALCTKVSESVGLPTSSLDPLALVDASAQVRSAAGSNVGRFAPVIGALFAPQNSSRLIDFSNPRKREEVKRPILQYAIAAAAALLLVGGGWWWYYSSNVELDDEIAQLTKQVDGQKDALKLSAKNVSDWNKIETFLKGDVVWIDELMNLSQKAKDSETAYFGMTSFTLEPRTNAATISSKYLTKKQEAVPEVQAALRDATHTVRGTAVTQSPDKNYPSASDLMIVLAPIKVADPRMSSKPNAVSADAPATTSTAQPPATAAAQPVAESPSAQLPSTQPSYAQPSSTSPSDAQPSTAASQPASAETQPDSQQQAAPESAPASPETIPVPPSDTTGSDTPKKQS